MPKEQIEAVTALMNLVAASLGIGLVFISAKKTIEFSKSEAVVKNTIKARMHFWLFEGVTLISALTFLGVIVYGAPEAPLVIVLGEYLAKQLTARRGGDVLGVERLRL